MNGWDIVNSLFTVGTLTATLRLATPVALAASGGVVSERAGVINLGLEGKMLSGAFAAAYVAHATGSPWLGLLAAALAGACMGALMAAVAIDLRANHVVAGIGLNMLALGMTTWLMQAAWGNRGASPTVPSLPVWNVPGLHKAGALGELFGSHSPLVYVMFIAVPALWAWLFRTPQGLRLRMIGERPAAAESVGISVLKTQRWSVVGAGVLAALGGAHLSLGHLSLFTANMSAGRGYMALAAVILGRWNPIGAALAALLFALTDAAQMRLQTMQSQLPAELVQMLPYALTIAVVAFAVKRSRPPAALGRHYPQSLE